MSDERKDWQGLAVDDASGHDHDSQRRIAADAIAASPRFSDLTLPAYRYLPGRDAHPMDDSNGHGFRQLSVVPDQSFHDQQLACRYCVDLFNHGYWWEAQRGFAQLADTPDAPSALLALLAEAADTLLKRRMGWRSAVAQGRGTVRRKALELDARQHFVDSIHAWLIEFDRSLRPGGNDFPRLKLAG